MNPRVGVAVLVKRDNKFLVGKRSGSYGPGTWAPPGGWIEWMENPGDTACREVREETGLLIADPRFFAVTNDILESVNDKPLMHAITLWFIADCEKGEPEELEPQKFTNFRWVSMQTVPSNMFPTWGNLTDSDYSTYLLNIEFSDVD